MWKLNLEKIETKRRAMAVYGGVIKLFLHPSSKENCIGLASYRGCKVGCGFAEAFECECVFRRN